MEKLKKNQKSKLNYLYQQLEKTPETGEGIEGILEEILEDSECKLDDILIIIRKSQNKQTLEKAYEKAITYDLNENDILHALTLAQSNISKDYLNALLKLT